MGLSSGYHATPFSMRVCDSEGASNLISKRAGKSKKKRKKEDYKVTVVQSPK